MVDTILDIVVADELTTMVYETINAALPEYQQAEPGHLVRAPRLSQALLDLLQASLARFLEPGAVAKSLRPPVLLPAATWDGNGLMGTHREVQNF